eukprot:262650_1
MGTFCSSCAVDADPPYANTELGAYADPFKATQLQWNTIAKTCDFQQLNDRLDSNCVSIQRMTSVLSKYHDTFLLFEYDEQSKDESLSFHQLIKTHFGNQYSLPYLLNDYIHIIHHHGTIFEMQNHCKYVPLECCAVHNVSKPVSSDYFGIHLLSLIHCNIYHNTYCNKSHRFETNASHGSNKQLLVNVDVVNTEPMHYYEIAPRFYDVPRKYHSLKEECLNHELSPLTASEWVYATVKSTQYETTRYIQTLKSTRSSASILNSPTVYSFDKNLIICLILWIDFQALSDPLRTSYHQQSKHSNHWHFAKGMRHIVEVFGVMHRHKTNYVYNHDRYIWHALTFDTAPKRHVMNWLRLKWNYPIATTQNLNILKRNYHADGHGVMVAFDRTDGYAFDCGWISKYQCEKEMLFMDCDDSKALPIQCLMDSKKAMRHMQLNVDVLRCFHAFVEMMNTESIPTEKSTDTDVIDYGEPYTWIGRPIWSVIDRDTNKWKAYLAAVDKYKELQHMMVMAMQQRFANVMRDSHVSACIRKAIHLYLKEKKKLCLDMQMFRKEHSFLIDLWLTKDLKCLDIVFIGHLFPHCTELIVHNIDTVVDKGFILSMFDAFKLMNNHAQMEQCALLIAGYIHMYNMWCVPNDIVHVIRSFYPSLRCKLKTIIFTKCVNQSVIKVLHSLSGVKPGNWNMGVVHDGLTFAVSSLSQSNIKANEKGDLYFVRGKKKEVVETKKKFFNASPYSQYYDH